MSQPVSPEILTPLRAPLNTLPGLGDRLSTLMAKLVGGDTVRDVLFHLPGDFLDRRASPTLREARPGMIATLRVEVIRHEPPAKKSQPHRVVISDGTGFADIVLFHAARLSQFPVGAKLLVSGKLEAFSDRLVMPHPDYVMPQTQAQNFPWIEPVWPLTAGIVPRIMRRAALGALTRLPDFSEWHDPTILARRGWPGFGAALRALHAPEQVPDDKPAERLAYDELLARQLAFAIVRSRRRKLPGRVLARRRQVARRGAATLRPRPHRRAIAGPGGNRRRSRSPAPHAAPAARRCRLRQNPGGAARHAARGGGRRAGGADGADRNSRQAAFRHVRKTLARACGVAHRRGQGQGPERDPEIPRATARCRSSSARMRSFRNMWNLPTSLWR